MREAPKEPLAWHALEYFYFEKSNDWYWGVGLIGVSAAVASFLFGNILFGVLLLVSTIVLSMYASREPELVYFELNRRGVMINGTLYPYANLESFFVHDDHDPHVLIKSKKVLMPYLSLPIEEVSPQEIKTYLHFYLKEVEHHEPFTVKLMEHFGF